VELVNRRIQSATRDRVVAQALTVIAQEGVGMLTMRTFAARLGVVPGALYRNGRVGSAAAFDEQQGDVVVELPGDVALQLGPQ
jgi:Bacterial regulatory proteins, tetR family